MDHDFRSYQSPETAWHYGQQILDARQKKEEAELAMREAEETLRWLQDHPPLYYAFNWSA